MIHRWSRGSAEDHMDEAILVDLAETIEAHPWWRARASLTISLLDRLGVRRPSRILDAGCGWGVTLRSLERAGHEVTGLDVSRMALERLDSPGRTLIEADLTQPFPHQQASFDVILALDVIEHLDDDRAAVANLARLLKPDGLMIVSVPALPEMFSEFDAVQGHRRRYERETLRAAFDQTELIVEQTLWWGQWLHRRLKASRSESRARPGDNASEVYRRYLTLPPWPVVQAIRVLFALEKPRALAGRLRRGTSLFAVARAPSACRLKSALGKPHFGPRHHASAGLIPPAEHDHNGPGPGEIPDWDRA